MKSCPACNRTFEDTLTFCLVDGAILSAPFDPLVTHRQQGGRDTTPPPTEIMLPPPVAPAANPLPPTFLSPAYGTPPQAHNHAAGPAQSPYPLYGQAGATQKKRGLPLWPFALGLLALFFVLATLHVGPGRFLVLLAITAALVFIIDIFRIVTGRR